MIARGQTTGAVTCCDSGLPRIDDSPRDVGRLPRRSARILGSLLWLFVDSAGYQRVSRLQTLIVCGHFRLSGWFL